MEEIELKLALAPEDVAAFRRSPALAGVRPRRRTLTNIYYDTPECDLAAAGMALRLRKSGGHWVQTLKGGASGTGGLHARGEWESARPDASIDLTALAGTPMDAMKEGVGGRLKPAFTVQFQRETWDVEPAPGTRFEVALDRGEALAGKSTDSVCEVEIELLEGEREAAFRFARTLVDAVRLRPSAVTKAQRGYRLFRGEALSPARARRVKLSGDMPTVQAARAIVAASLDQLQANEEGVLASTDPEFLHQARVGLRRLRSALRIFRDVLPADAQRWRSALGEAGRALGVARDWDVLATATLPPLAKAFGQPGPARSVTARVAARRRRARESAREALRSQAYAQLVLDVASWLADTSAPTPAPAEPVHAFALRLIRKRHKRLLADAKGIERRSAAERHAVRIDAKRLRYAVDGFASLLREKRVEAYLDALAALQDLLGTSNDAATAMRLLTEASPSPSFTAFARGWLASRIDGEVRAVGALVDKLASAKKVWS